jgi:hypothetical protein
MDEIRGVRCAEFTALIYWMGRSVSFYSSGDVGVTIAAP